MSAPAGWPHTDPEPWTGDPCDTGPCDLCPADGSPCICRCHSGHLTLSQVLTAVHDVDVWLDGAVAEIYQGQPLAQDWARVAKVVEEAGESVAALIACTGQNPRKGVCGTQDDMLAELADTAMTAIFGIQHFTKDAQQTWAIVSAAMAKAHARALAARSTATIPSAKRQETP